MKWLQRLKLIEFPLAAVRKLPLRIYSNGCIVAVSGRVLDFYDNGGLLSPRQLVNSHLANSAVEVGSLQPIAVSSMLIRIRKKESGPSVFKLLLQTTCGCFATGLLLIDHYYQEFLWLNLEGITVIRTHEMVLFGGRDGFYIVTLVGLALPWVLLTAEFIQV